MEGLIKKYKTINKRFITSSYAQSLRIWKNKFSYKSLQNTGFLCE